MSHPKNPPSLPPRNAAVEAAVGRFIFAWGALEGEIDNAIHDLLLTNLKTGMVVTANLAIRAKLDLAHALFEELRAGEDPIWRPVSADWETRFDQLVNLTAKANVECRIPLVHGIPRPILWDDGAKTLWVKFAARKGGLRGMGVTYTRKFIDDQTAQVVALVNEWGEARAHWKRAVYAMRCSDADEWLSRPPDEEDHLLLQLQSTRGSAEPKPKQPRQPKPSRRAKREARNSQK